MSNSFATSWTARFLCPWGFPGKNTGVGSSSGDLRHPGIEPVASVSPVLAGRCFTTEPPGKPAVCRAMLTTLWKEGRR